jgi:two-component system chemotaxis response regulator CheY
MTWLLVAEDDEDLREMLADALREHGYEVHTAGDGAEAVQMLDAAIEMPAVLLLDLLMPRLSGHEVLRAIRSVGRARHLPVVLITGLELRDSDISAFHVTDVLEKPIALERLFAAVDKARAP